MSFVRTSKDAKQKVYVVSNFTPVPRKHFRIGVDEACSLSLALNTDASEFWGSNYEVVSEVDTQNTPWNDRPYSVEVTLPPLSTVFYITNLD